MRLLSRDEVNQLRPAEVGNAIFGENIARLNRYNRRHGYVLGG